jgi:hypothetical protein
MAVTGAQKRVLEAAKEAARELDSDGGRELVPLIGELSAAKDASPTNRTPVMTPVAT